MIKLNDRFHFERDKYQWLLHEYKAGKDKDGNAKQQKCTTFHPNIEQICNVILNRSGGDCDSMSELKELYRNAVGELASHIETHADEAT